MNAASFVKASSWLLHDEADLTPDQVWLALAQTGQHGLIALQEGIVIADTAAQAAKAVGRSGWTYILLFNETSVDTLIAEAPGQPLTLVARLSHTALVEMREKLRNVRLNRGYGAMSDGRQFENRAERWSALAKERVGADVYESNLKKLAEKLEGNLPGRPQASVEAD